MAVYEKAFKNVNQFSVRLSFSCPKYGCCLFHMIPENKKKKQVSAKEQVRSHEDKSQSQSDEKILIATWHEGSTSSTNYQPPTTTTTWKRTCKISMWSVSPTSSRLIQGWKRNWSLQEWAKPFLQTKGRKETKGQIRDRNHHGFSGL